MKDLAEISADIAETVTLDKIETWVRNLPKDVKMEIDEHNVSRTCIVARYIKDTVTVEHPEFIRQTKNHAVYDGESFISVEVPDDVKILIRRIDTAMEKKKPRTIWTKRQILAQIRQARENAW